MKSEYFQFRQLLSPPIKRSAYSDRTAWIMAEMSRIAYLRFEKDDVELKKALSTASFELISIFDRKGTQAFLARNESDKMMVLAFRGTEKRDMRDIMTDLNARFYTDDKGNKTHVGFLKAFNAVEEVIRQKLDNYKDYGLYITGHSLGGALALVATREFNSDNIAACYTFGSPKVGNDEFGYDIKPPIYRVVNAFDPVPTVPPTYIFYLLSLLPWQWAKMLVAKFHGYQHHGDMRFLTKCDETCSNVKVIANYHDLFRLIGLWMNKKHSVGDHSIEIYCHKLGQWALQRLAAK
jgi:triacylglycerol lipase